MTTEHDIAAARRSAFKIAAAACALLAASAIQVSAVEIGSGNSGLNSPGYNADLQAAQNRLQRQQYQQLQQIQREQDRLTTQQPQPRPEVPRVKPGCQVQIYGNRTVTTCR